jgi:hypothetical protein
VSGSIKVSLDLFLDVDVLGVELVLLGRLRGAQASVQRLAFHGQLASLSFLDVIDAIDPIESLEPSQLPETPKERETVDRSNPCENALNELSQIFVCGTGRRIRQSP